MLVPVECFGHPLGVLAGPVHAQRDGGEPPAQHPALVRLKDVAEHDTAAEQHLNQLRTRG